MFSMLLHNRSLHVFLQRFKVNMFPNESKLYGIITVIHKDSVYLYICISNKQHILNTTQMHSEYQLVGTAVRTN